MAKKQNFIKVAIMALLKAFDTKLEEVKTDSGAVLYAEVFEAGEPIFITEGDAQIPLPVGDYTLEDGRKLSVTEEGIIAAIAEADAPADPENPEMTTETAPEKKMYSVEDIKALIDAGLSKEKAENADKVKALETKLAELEAKLETEPEGIKPNPEGRKTEPVKLNKNLSPIEQIFERMCES